MRIQELTKSYDRNTVVDNVSFEIHKGTVTSLSVRMGLENLQ